MLSLKNSLAVLRKTNALLDGHFVLSSGLHSPSYVQCAKLLSFPNKSEKFTKSLASKIKKTFRNIDLILSPAMGGIIIGYEIGKLLSKETIFAERVNEKFVLRRDFKIKKNQKVVIVEDVITTGKSSQECAKLIAQYNAELIGYACIIDRSQKKSVLKKKIISQIELDIPIYSQDNLPKELSVIKAVKPGSRNL